MKQIKFGPFLFRYCSRLDGNYIKDGIIVLEQPPKLTLGLFGYNVTLLLDSQDTWGYLIFWREEC